MAVLSKAGDQVPVILLAEVAGSGLPAAPAQIGAIAPNVGNVLAGLTTMVKVVAVAHCPVVGVKV